jgi:hypothetical protein
MHKYKVTFHIDPIEVAADCLFDAWIKAEEEIGFADLSHFIKDIRIIKEEEEGEEGTEIEISNA